MNLYCTFCFYAKPFEQVPAEFIVNGQSVCEDHVTTAMSVNPEFGRVLDRLNYSD